MEQFSSHHIKGTYNQPDVTVGVIIDYLMLILIYQLLMGDSRQNNGSLKEVHIVTPTTSKYGVLHGQRD